MTTALSPEVNEILVDALQHRANASPQWVQPVDEEREHAEHDRIHSMDRFE